MILIISSKDDISTSDVIDWLRRFGAKYERISSDEKVKVSKIEINNRHSDAQIIINSNLYRLSEIKAVWYRRSWMSLDKYIFYSGLDSRFDSDMNEQLTSEVYYLSNFIEEYLIKRMLNRRSDVMINKLNVLQFASDLGLSIPYTEIISEKKHLQELNIRKSLISKNFSPGVFVGYDDKFLNGYTLEVTKKMINELPRNFHPMLFQENIEKSFEIRSFYLNEKFYSSAIFSQSDELTKLDFRNYNFKKPNRTPPFTLPNEIEAKLILLMAKLQIQSGSIDLLVKPNGEFVFLEINPIGQFSQVSRPCNYLLERKIAESLINNLHERKN